MHVYLINFLYQFEMYSHIHLIFISYNWLLGKWKRLLHSTGKFTMINLEFFKVNLSEELFLVTASEGVTDALLKKNNSNSKKFLILTRRRYTTSSDLLRILKLLSCLLLHISASKK